MPTETRIVTPGPSERVVRTAEGENIEVPVDWELLPPGDAALTRRVKAAGPCWSLQEMKGRRKFSRGVWAPAARISAIRTELETERSTPSYSKRREADAQRRQRKQATYVDEFRNAVILFLDFAPCHANIAEQLADAVTNHATPVGSGTVARTARIPIMERASAAVIAWLRHRTTDYDTMKIERVKGKRREIRRRLAERSRHHLQPYREARVDPQQCLLQQALRADGEAAC